MVEIVYFKKRCRVCRVEMREVKRFGGSVECSCENEGCSVKQAAVKLQAEQERHQEEYLRRLVARRERARKEREGRPQVIVTSGEGENL